MKKMIVGILLLLATSVWGSDFCRKLEYADLKDMSKEELIEGIKVDANKYNNLKEGKVSVPIQRNSELYWSAINDCLERLDDFTKQLKRR